MGEWLALDVGGTKVRQAVVGEGGAVRAARTSAWGVAPDPIVTRDAVVAQWRRDGVSHPLGLGIAIAAMVDASDTVRAAPNLPAWEGLDLAELFAELGCPVRVVFDGTAALLGELWLGQPELENAWCVSIGTGIGGGLVVDGVVLHGAHRLSGMATSGLVAGRAGLGLESVASGPAVAAASSAGSGVEALERWRAGDPAARAAFARASEVLYAAIAAVTSVVDVERVVVAGGFGVNAFEALFPEAALPATYRFYRLVHDDVRIGVALTGELAPLLGAARHAAASAAL